MKPEKEKKSINRRNNEMMYDKEQTRKKLHAIMDSIIEGREDVSNADKIPTWKTNTPTPAMIYTALYRLGLTTAERGLIGLNHTAQIGLTEDIKDIFSMLAEKGDIGKIKMWKGGDFNE